MAEKFQMTQKGYDEAVKLLKYLQGTKRKEIVARIAEARSHGDLSENAEYDAARTEQSNNEMEIEELDYKIKNAEIVAENNDTSKVNIGNVVKVYDPDLEEEETYEITGCTCRTARTASNRKNPPLPPAFFQTSRENPPASRPKLLRTFRI